MKKVATINGVDVFSDKNVSSIQDTKINFSDGSWCDINTNEVVNEGKGSISIGNKGKKSSSKKITKPAQTFKASKLELETLTANIIVEVEKRSDIEVIIEGTESELKDISLKEISGILKISGKSNNTSNSQTIIKGNLFSSFVSNFFGNSNVISSGDISVSINNNSSSITINDKGAASKIIIKVPMYTPIKAKSITGSVLLGDTEGNIDISNSGSTSYNIGKITNTKIQSQGDGNIDIKSITGSLNVHSIGDGEITIEKGNIKNLDIYCKGDGGFSFDGEVGSTSISSNGDSDIDIKSINGNLNITSIGDGEITIEKGSIKNLNISYKGDGIFSFDGKVENASIYSNGDSDIDINYVKNKPSIYKKGDGDINIGNW